ncbi:cupin domain-containing protein [Arthrobacter sp. JSM 101049]|uniref:cupin domain-containing protein n=1 Tax=Arthrobacter sp. JSM 101049 TaxID=929097 RepID=UPI003568E8D6
MLERAGHATFDYTLHDGAAPVRIQHHFVDELGMAVNIQTWELPVGGSEGMHRHDGGQPLQEFYQVISGRALMHLQEQQFRLGPGDSLLAPAGVEHDVVNDGDEPLRLITVWGPPGFMDTTGFGSVDRARAMRRMDG